MKHILLISGLAATLLMGCSKEEEEVPAPSAPIASGGTITAVDPLAANTGISSAQAEPFDPSKVGPPPPPMVDFGSGVSGARPLGNQGQEMNDLELLNYLVFNYNESRGTYSTDVTPNFKSDAERLAYDEALKKLKEPITDLNELVKGKVIKSIPAAPAGKKYVINPQTHKVELVDATAPAQP